MFRLQLQNWKFHYGEVIGGSYKGLDDTTWEAVVVPHDWSVHMPFSREHSSGTGYLAGGTAWYRCRFSLPAEAQGKRVVIGFDGVYKNSRVWCNSNYLGQRPSGYSAFAYDITPFVACGEVENEISVQVSHEDIADSRWFTGSGIYRKVTVRVMEPVYTQQDSLFFTTPAVTQDRADVVVQSTLVNDTDETVEIEVKHDLKGKSSSLQLAKTVSLAARSSQQVVVQGVLQAPERWSVEAPNLYDLATTLSGTIAGQSLHAVQETLKVGVRSLRFCADMGFFLNEKPMKFKGVCVHHDAGCLGAAVWPQVWERRLEKLKKMGCNAIRMSHNPHMTELYDLCDRMGFLAMDEAFDEWEGCKNKWSTGHNVYPPKHQGYAQDFPQWHERDLTDLVCKNRNHPSIVMWSVGNEVDYPNDPYCHPLFKEVTGNNDSNKPLEERLYNPNKPNAERLATIAANLTAIVKQHDTTRPVLAASALPELSTRIHFTDAFDVVGYNYKEHLYKEDHERFPHKPLLGSENSHGWEEWLAVTENDYISGQFLWTGIDFLGETVGWPLHGSAAGLLTLAGDEKTGYYRRQSMWSDEPVAYLATRLQSDELLWPETLMHHWDYQPGEVIQVVCYTNQPQAELFLNDKSLGMAQREKGVILWELPFERGTLWLRAGKAEDSVASTFPATQILAQRWSKTIDMPTGAYRLEQIEIAVADEQGRCCAFDRSMLTVVVSGAAVLIGLENGDIGDNNDYAFPFRRVYNGKLLAYILCETGNATPVEVTISAEHMPAVIVNL